MSKIAILQRKSVQTGRSLIEVIGVLVIMTAIVILSFRVYTLAMRHVKMNALKHDIGVIQQQVKHMYFKRSYLQPGWVIGTDQNFQSLLVLPGFYKNNETPFGGKYELEAEGPHILKILVGTPDNPIKTSDCNFISHQHDLKNLHNILIQYNCDNGIPGEIGDEQTSNIVDTTDAVIIPDGNVIDISENLPPVDAVDVPTDTGALVDPADAACVAQYGKPCSSMTLVEAEAACLANGDLESCKQFGRISSLADLQSLCFGQNNYNACSAIPFNNYVGCNSPAVNCGGDIQVESILAVNCAAGGVKKGTASCQYLIDNPQYINGASAYRACAVNYSGSSADRDVFCKAIIDNSINGTPGDRINIALTDVCALNKYYSAEACATLRSHPELCSPGQYFNRIPSDIKANCGV